MCTCSRLLRIVVVLGITGTLVAASLTAQDSGKKNPDDQAPAAEPSPKPDLTAAADSIIKATNAFRREEKREQLRVHKQLTETADDFARFMARTDKYSHTADGKEPAERAAEHDYEYCVVAENIAFQFSSAGFETEELADGFVTGWKKSPGHRRNMLDPDVLETGVAVARSADSGKYYAVQMFARPKSAIIEFEISNPTEIEVTYAVGKEEFQLPPGSTRSHGLCRPELLKLVPHEKEPPAEAKPKALKSRHGGRYVIRSTDSGAKLEQVSTPKPASQPPS